MTNEEYTFKTEFVYEAKVLIEKEAISIENTPQSSAAPSSGPVKPRISKSVN